MSSHVPQRTKLKLEVHLNGLLDMHLRPRAVQQATLLTKYYSACPMVYTEAEIVGHLYCIRLLECFTPTQRCAIRVRIGMPVLQNNVIIQVTASSIL